MQDLITAVLTALEKTTGRQPTLVQSKDFVTEDIAPKRQLANDTASLKAAERSIDLAEQTLKIDFSARELQKTAAWVNSSGRSFCRTSRTRITTSTSTGIWRPKVSCRYNFPRLPLMAYCRAEMMARTSATSSVPVPCDFRIRTAKPRLS